MTVAEIFTGLRSRVDWSKLQFFLKLTH